QCRVVLIAGHRPGPPRDALSYFTAIGKFLKHAPHDELRLERDQLFGFFQLVSRRRLQLLAIDVELAQCGLAPNCGEALLSSRAAQRQRSPIVEDAPRPDVIDRTVGALTEFRRSQKKDSVRIQDELVT